MSKSGADQIREIANLALGDALNIVQLTALLEGQNAGGVNKRLSDAGADNAAITARNAMIAYLVVLISRAYADPKPGDLHLRVAADLLKSDTLARSIFNAGDASKKVAEFEAQWAACRGDYRLQRINHFRDKFTAHLGEPKDIPVPLYRELFAFGDATVKAIELLALAIGVADKPIESNIDAVLSANAFWKPWK